MNLFRKYKLLKWLFVTLSKYGVYVKIEWGHSFWMPRASLFGLHYTNRYGNYTYRLKLCYLNKQQRIVVKNTRSMTYSIDLPFILTPQ